MKVPDCVSHGSFTGYARLVTKHQCVFAIKNWMYGKSKNTFLKQYNR